MKLDRRHFAITAAAAPLAFAAAKAQTPPQEGAIGPSQAVPPTNGTDQVRSIVTRLNVEPFAQPITFARNKQAPKLKPFPLNEVRLGEGPFREMHAANAGYMKRLSADSLLHVFRVNAGIASNAAPLGGWEDPKGELRGHFVGHYLSACALGWASAGDAELKHRGDVIVAGLAQCQSKLNQGGYLSAYPTEFYDRLQKGDTYVWAPFYTMHKMLAGLYDMHTLAANAQALDVLKGMCGWVDTWTAQWDEAHMQRILQVEFGGMQESLYNLADLTGEDRWARVGDRFTKKAVFNPLASSRDELAGLHMNTHIPQIIGAAKRYEISGDHRFHDVAQFFWETVATRRSYATGGASNREHWLAPAGKLSAEWAAGQAHQECCCSYNMMKLTRHLFGWEPQAAHMDYFERNLVNHRLGTIKPDGMNQYFISLTPGAWRTYGGETDTFWCCNGSAVEEYNKLSDTIYYNDGSNLWVNLFLPSSLDWKEQGIRLTQTTRFPDEARTHLTIEAAPTKAFAINLRIPGWAHDDVRVLVNGKALDVSAVPGSYLRLHRVWKKGDSIALEMPMHLHAQPFADNPNITAVLYGPLVLAGQFALGDVVIHDATKHGPDVAASPITVPTLSVGTRPPQDWLEAAGPLTWRCKGIAQAVTLKPFYKTDGRYTVYWQTA
jgi:DUF1680 family protein